MFFYCIPAPEAVSPTEAVEHARRYFSPFFRDALNAFGGDVRIPVLAQEPLFREGVEVFATCGLKTPRVAGELRISTEEAVYVEEPPRPLDVAVSEVAKERDAARTAQAAAEKALAEAKATIERYRGMQERLATAMKAVDAAPRSLSTNPSQHFDESEILRDAEEVVLKTLAEELVRMEGVGR